MLKSRCTTFSLEKNETSFSRRANALARSFIIRDFNGFAGNLKPLWNVDDEKTINAEDPELNRDEMK